MKSFFYVGKPVSQNNRGSVKMAKYRSDLTQVLNSSFGIVSHMFNPSDELHGIVIYFRKKPHGLDADNVSKPLWDALENVCYQNDKVIKLRLAGVITQDYNNNYTIPLSGLDSIEINTINQFFMNTISNDMIYVVIDKLAPSNIKFRL